MFAINVSNGQQNIHVHVFANSLQYIHVYHMQLWIQCCGYIICTVVKHFNVTFTNDIVNRFVTIYRVYCKIIIAICIAM